VPALPDEWQCLNDGAKVVLVKTVGDDGIPRNPIEFFVVKKVPGKNPVKFRPVSVYGSKPEVPTLSLVQPAAPVESAPPVPVPCGTVRVIDKSDRILTVTVYRIQDELRQARDAGTIESGTHVAAEDRRSTDGRYQVELVRREGGVLVNDTIGLCHLQKESKAA
jgi:hypothetical protein